MEKLEQFRRENNFVDPLAEGENLKGYINATKREITALENTIERLNNIKKDISRGNVNSSSYKELVGEVNNAATVEITNPEEKLSSQVKELNEELGNALRVYTQIHTLLEIYSQD